LKVFSFGMLSGMRIPRTIAVVVLLLCASCGRGKPDFTGTWVQTSNQPIPGAPEDPDLEPQMTVTQNASTLTSWVTFVSKSNRSKKHKSGSTTFQLDGSERRNGSTVSKTYWEGDTLVFMNNRFERDQLVSTHTVEWSLDKNGMLVVENTLTTPGQDRPARMRRVHKRIQEEQ